MRGYVDFRWGQAHYRAYGESGPPLVLLHESPQSSDILQWALPPLGERLRAYAFDTPGYGLSDPPPEAQEIPVYAEATLEAIDALGLAVRHLRFAHRRVDRPAHRSGGPGPRHPRNLPGNTRLHAGEEARASGIMGAAA